MVTISNISFKGIPNNYSKVDKFFSRSAQPQMDDFKWLKEQGVTDIINFRTMTVSGLDFSEKDVVESLGMKYHNIPTITSKPSSVDVLNFLNLLSEIEKNKGKAHVHCKAGADRTGMYSFIYKAVKGIGSAKENETEWIQKGHNIDRYPNLMAWTKNLLKELIKK